MTDRQEMEAVLEAILFVAHDPVSRDRLLEVFGENEREAADAALEAVIERYREKPGHGVMIDEVAGGLRLVTRPDLHSYLKRFFEISSANKLSMAALESLAIIAYRQPITAPEVQELRNVNSSGVIKKLLERRLVRIAGRKEVVGKPFLYATTREFLMHFGLKSLKELPPLEQFEELFGDELELEADSGEAPEPDPEEQVEREAAELRDAEDEEAREQEIEAIDEERAAAADEEEPGADPEAEEVDGTLPEDAVDVPKEEGGGEVGGTSQELPEDPGTDDELEPEAEENNEEPPPEDESPAVEEEIEV